MNDCTIFLQIPAELRFLSAIGQFVGGLFASFEELAQEDQLRYDLELIVSEACTNVIRHAYTYETSPRIMQLKICYELEKFCIEIVDFGPGFAFEEIQEPDFNEPREGGMGLFIIKQLADKIEYIRQGQANILHLEKFL